MYNRITNLPENAHELNNPELAALASVWSERKGELEEGGEYQEFIKRLQREWAIETGIIERLYTWDRGVTEILIQQGIDSTLIAHQSGLRREQADHVKNMIQDQLEIVEGLFSFVKGEQPLTEHFIRGMQAQFTASQDYTEAQTLGGDFIRVELLKGGYKTLPNNPRRTNGSIHEYCPPELVNEEMRQLVTWYYAAESDTPPEVLSAWLHHRFAQIHPFQDGNGRVARALATLVFLKKGLFPLVIRDVDRRTYINALERADAGNLKSLVALFAQRQRDSILAAIGIEQQVQQSRYAEEIIFSAVQVLKGRFTDHLQEVDRVYEVAEQLRGLANQRLSDIASSLDAQLAPLTPPDHDPYHANTRSANNDSREKHYFSFQIIQIARKFSYFANTEPYRAWARLVIATEEIFEVVISFHGYGRGNKGVMVASALTFQRVPKEDGGTEVANIRAAMTDLFQFNYAESPETTVERFREWLEAAVAIGLAEWKQVIDA